MYKKSVPLRKKSRILSTPERHYRVLAKYGGSNATSPSIMGTNSTKGTKISRGEVHLKSVNVDVEVNHMIGAYYIMNIFPV